MLFVRNRARRGRGAILPCSSLEGSVIHGTADEGFTGADVGMELRGCRSAGSTSGSSPPKATCVDVVSASGELALEITSSSTRVSSCRTSPASYPAWKPNMPTDAGSNAPSLRRDFTLAAIGPLPVGRHDVNPTGLRVAGRPTARPARRISHSDLRPAPTTETSCRWELREVARWAQYEIVPQGAQRFAHESSLGAATIASLIQAG